MVPGPIVEETIFGMSRMTEHYSLVNPVRGTLSVLAGGTRFPREYCSGNRIIQVHFILINMSKLPSSLIVWLDGQIVPIILSIRIIYWNIPRFLGESST